MLVRTAILPLLFCAVALRADQVLSNDLVPATAQNADLNTKQLASVPERLLNLSSLAPDSGQVVALYQSARTVNDIETANDKVGNDIARTQSIASEISRLYQSVATSCERIDISQVQPIADKLRSLSEAVFMIDGQLARSLLTLQKQTQSRKLSMAEWNSAEDVRRFELAVHKFGQLRVQAQEMAKAVDRFVVSIRLTSEACRPATIPPLFARGGTLLFKQSSARGQKQREPKQRPVTLAPAPQ
jgi:hypothetical protein